MYTKVITSVCKGQRRLLVCTKEITSVYNAKVITSV